MNRTHQKPIVLDPVIVPIVPSVPDGLVICPEEIKPAPDPEIGSEQTVRIPLDQFSVSTHLCGYNPSIQKFTKWTPIVEVPDPKPEKPHSLLSISDCFQLNVGDGTRGHRKKAVNVAKQDFEVRQLPAKIDLDFRGVECGGAYVMIEYPDGFKFQILVSTTGPHQMDFPLEKTGKYTLSYHAGTAGKKLDDSNLVVSVHQPKVNPQPELQISKSNLVVS